jgi:enoyl-[acyl-carrier protein] reductase I
MPGSPLFSCDVTKQEEVDATFKQAGEQFGRLDFVIHSIAFAPREALEGEYMKVERDAFLTALEISAYSLTQMARAAAPLMTEGGSIVTMTFHGADKVYQGYNVMGVAKAAWNQACVIWRRTLARKTFASTQSAPGQFKRCQPGGVRSQQHAEAFC